MTYFNQADRARLKAARETLTQAQETFIINLKTLLPVGRAFVLNRSPFGSGRPRLVQVEEWDGATLRVRDARTNRVFPVLHYHLNHHCIQPL